MADGKRLLFLPQQWRCNASALRVLHQSPPFSDLPMERVSPLAGGTQEMEGSQFHRGQTQPCTSHHSIRQHHVGGREKGIIERG